jgi:hypothetical protein
MPGQLSCFVRIALGNGPYPTGADCAILLLKGETVSPRRTLCKKCQQTGTVFTALNEEELSSALNRNEDIQIFHLVGEDHAWSISTSEFLAL